MNKLFFALLLLPSLLRGQTIGRMTVDSFPIYDWSVYPSAGLTYGLTWLPVSYKSSPTKTYPLIIQLPGTGQTGSGIAGLSTLITDGLCQNIAGGWNPVAVNPLDRLTYEFIVITAQNPGWSYLYDQMQYILPNILARYRVDPSRIYLTGFSAGGDGVFTCITANPSFTQQFAAIAAASSAPLDGSQAMNLTAQQMAANLRYVSKSYGVGAWVCVGTQDKLESVPYVDSINWLGPAMPAKFTYLQNVGHSAWKQLYTPAFRPAGNYYGKKAETFPAQPNNNGSTVEGSGKTQDSLNLFEWFLTFQRQGTTAVPPPQPTPTPTPTPVPTPAPARKAQRWKIAPGVFPNIAPAGDVGINIKAGSLIPGDTVDISDAYAWTYGAVQGNGTADSPIVIINSGTGRATFTGGFTIRGQHIHMTGMGIPGLPDGFLLTNPTPHLRSQGPFAVTITDSSAYVEVEHLYIYHTGIGFNVKNENSCDPGLQYPAWTIHNISLHDNVLIGIWNEAFYLGNTSPDNGKNSYDPRPVVCNGDTVYPRPLRVGRIYVYNNFIDSTGRGAIQIEGCDTSMSEISFNMIMHSGMNGDPQQGTGISVGAYGKAYIHDNTVLYSYTWSFAALGFDTINLEHNHFDSAGFLNAFSRANTAAQTFDPATEPVYPNPLAWVQSLFFKSVPTLSGDSSVARVYNNYVGTCRMMSQQIDLLDKYNLFKKNGATVFCGNTGAAGASPINLETPSISYSLCPVAPTPGPSGCPVCPTCPLPRKATSVLLNGVWVPLTGVTLKYDDGSTVNQ